MLTCSLIYLFIKFCFIVKNFTSITMDSDSESDFETHFRNHKSKFLEDLKTPFEKTAAAANTLCEPEICVKNGALIKRKKISKLDGNKSPKKKIVKKERILKKTENASSCNSMLAAVLARRKTMKQRSNRLIIDEGNNECLSEQLPSCNKIEDDSVIVNVLWRSLEPNKFKVKKLQNLNCIFEYYAKKIDKDPSLLLFTLNDREISIKDNCYVSLQLDDTKTIEVGLLPDSYLNRKQNLHGTIPVTEGVRYKIQCAKKKFDSFHVFLKENEKLDQIFWQISQQLKLPPEQMKLYFDGDLINSNKTARENGLEPEDCLDLQF